MDLVSIIKTLPSNQHRTLFIVCPFNPDGAKSAGIARVLINEHQLWTVRLLHVDENLSDAEIDESIQRLQNAQSHVRNHLSFLYCFFDSLIICIIFICLLFLGS